MKKIFSFISILLVAGFMSTSVYGIALTPELSNSGLNIDGILNPDAGQVLYQNGEKDNRIVDDPDNPIEEIVSILEQIENVTIEGYDLAESIAQTILDILGEDYTVDQAEEVLKALDKVLGEQPWVKCMGTKCPGIVHSLQIDSEYKAEKFGELIGQVTEYVNELHMLNKNCSSKDNCFIAGASPEELFSKAIEAMNKIFPGGLDDVYQLHVATNALMQRIPLDPKEALEISDVIARAEEVWFTGKDPVSTLEAAVFSILEETDVILPEPLTEKEKNLHVRLATKIISTLDEVLKGDSRFDPDDVHFDVESVMEGEMFAEAVNALIDIAKNKEGFNIALYVDRITPAIEYAVENLDLDSKKCLAEQFRDNIIEFIRGKAIRTS